MNKKWSPNEKVICKVALSEGRLKVMCWRKEEVLIEDWKARRLTEIKINLKMTKVFYGFEKAFWGVKINLILAKSLQIHS